MKREERKTAKFLLRAGMRAESRWPGAKDAAIIVTDKDILIWEEPFVVRDLGKYAEIDYDRIELERFREGVHEVRMGYGPHVKTLVVNLEDL